mmetsp:Transcript_46940/g.50671  ORF Transcript_46940/g.50671 Transcript_46940/m.50671 type:complete len:100 (+) Transcript_46940:73-372(+)
MNCVMETENTNTGYDNNENKTNASNKTMSRSCTTTASKSNHSLMDPSPGVVEFRKTRGCGRSNLLSNFVGIIFSHTFALQCNAMQYQSQLFNNFHHGRM